MPINVNDPEYAKAEIAFHEAKTTQEQLIHLNKMISLAPSHKGAENLRAQLKTRRKKLEEQIEKSKRSGKSTKVGIKKEDMQCVIVGKTNSGKSTLLKLLTNSQPEISQNRFTTSEPQIGMMPYDTTSIQLIEIPSIDSEFYDKGIVYTADTVLILIEKIEEINEIEKELKTLGKKIIILNKSDKLSENEKRKFQATLKSKFKKYNFIIFSSKNPHSDEIEKLKDKIFKSFEVCRIYTKEPGQELNENLKKRPMILSPGSTIEDVAEKILKGFSKRIKQVRIWGPSSKFAGQIVGLKHKVKDLDIVEFKTK